MTELRTPRDVLKEALGERAELVDAAVSIFDLAQFLLDDDERLTKSGALDGVGREQLQARTIELLGGPPATDPDEDEALQASLADTTHLDAADDDDDDDGADDDDADDGTLEDDDDGDESDGAA